MTALKATVVALGLAWLSAPAGAAGLGKLTLLSGLGQPLRAEVELTATRDELSSLTARLASHDAFRRAGVEFTSTLAGIKFAVGKRPDGRSIVRITSDRPLDEPFLDLLLELNWASGRLVREYTFLLDPPETMASRQTVQPVTVPAVSAAAPAAAPVAAAQAPAPQPRPAVSADSTREVRQGETLHRIATESRHEGVTVDQMLVAIFRANPGAFDGNMNRMHSGSILSIPGREAAASVAVADARRIVVAQSEDFAAYRRKLAEAAGAAPAPAESAPRQTVAGKITPQVEEAARPAEPKDQLKVSKAEAGKGAPGTVSERVAQARITALEEDLVAKEKALKEANARMNELEKNLKELQKLLEVKSQTLADAQKSAEAAPSPAPEPKAAEPAPAAAVQPPAAAPAPAAAAAAEAPKAEAPPAEARKAEAPPAPPPAAKTPAAPPEPEPEFVDELLDNPLALFGGAAALLGGLGVLGYRLRQRREAAPAMAPPTSMSVPAQSVFGTTGGQSVDTTGSSSIQSDFSQSGLSSIDADEGVDPVAEADVYMAYGRDAQAEEILLDALKNEPTRHAIHVKLLEIYAQRKSVKQFETLSGELYAQTGGAGPEWEKAVALGRKLDPANPLFGGPGAAPEEETSPTERTVVVSSPDKLRDTWTMPGELGQIASAVEGQTTTVVLPEPPVLDAAGAPRLDLDFDLGGLEQAPQEAPASAVGATAEGKSLDFDLGLDFAAGRHSDASAETVIFEPGTADMAGPELDVDLGLQAGDGHGQGAQIIDFDLGQPAAAAAAPAAAVDIEATDARGNVMSLAFEPPAAPAQQEVVDIEHTDIAANLVQFQLEGQKPAASEPMDLERTDFAGSVLDFNFNLDEPQAAEQAAAPAAPPAVPPVDLSSIDLDLGTAEPVTEAPVDEDGDQEVLTKLELALAYEEMGDKEGARELLDEVLKEGNDAQQQRARDILARLG